MVSEGPEWGAEGPKTGFEGPERNSEKSETDSEGPVTGANCPSIDSGGPDKGSKCPETDCGGPLSTVLMGLRLGLRGLSQLKRGRDRWIQEFVPLQGRCPKSITDEW